MNDVKVVRNARHGEWKILARARGTTKWALLGIAYTETVAALWARSLRGPPEHSGEWAAMVRAAESRLNQNNA